MFNKFCISPGRVESLRFTGGSTGGEIAPAVTGKKLRLLALCLTTDTAGNVSVRDDNGTPKVLVGPQPVAADGGYVLPFSPVGWGDTNSGKNLNVLLSTSATTFGGVVTYQILDSGN